MIFSPALNPKRMVELWKTDQPHGSQGLGTLDYSSVSIQVTPIIVLSPWIPGRILSFCFLGNLLLLSEKGARTVIHPFLLCRDY